MKQQTRLNLVTVGVEIGVMVDDPGSAKAIQMKRAFDIGAEQFEAALATMAEAHVEEVVGRLNRPSPENWNAARIEPILTWDFADLAHRTPPVSAPTRHRVRGEVNRSSVWQRFQAFLGFGRRDRIA